MGTVYYENNTAEHGFSRADESVPDTTRTAVLYRSSIPISSQADSRDCGLYKEKITLPGTPADVSMLVSVTGLDPEGPISIASTGILTCFPFASEGFP